MLLGGSFREYPFPLLLEIFLRRRETGLLEVSSPEESGYFYIKNGKVKNGQIGNSRGAAAVQLVGRLADGSFRFKPLEATDYARVVWQQSFGAEGPATAPQPFPPPAVRKKPGQFRSYPAVAYRASEEALASLAQRALRQFRLFTSSLNRPQQRTRRPLAKQTLAWPSAAASFAKRIEARKRLQVWEQSFVVLAQRGLRHFRQDMEATYDSLKTTGQSAARRTKTWTSAAAALPSKVEARRRLQGLGQAFLLPAQRMQRKFRRDIETTYGTLKTTGQPAARETKTWTSAAAAFSSKVEAKERLEVLGQAFVLSARQRQLLLNMEATYDSLPTTPQSAARETKTWTSAASDFSKRVDARRRLRVLGQAFVHSTQRIQRKLRLEMEATYDRLHTARQSASRRTKTWTSAASAFSRRVEARRRLQVLGQAFVLSAQRAQRQFRQDMEATYDSLQTTGQSAARRTLAYATAAYGFSKRAQVGTKLLRISQKGLVAWRDSFRRDEQLILRYARSLSFQVAVPAFPKSAPITGSLKQGVENNFIFALITVVLVGLSGISLYRLLAMDHSLVDKAVNVDEDLESLVPTAKVGRTRAKRNARQGKASKGIKSIQVPKEQPVPPQTEPVEVPENESRDDSSNRASETLSEVHSIPVVLQIENGRVSQASVVTHRPGMENFEAAALQIARQRRYVSAGKHTETIVVRVMKPRQN